jgi:hypothetical protein
MSDEETSQGNSRWLLVAGWWLVQVKKLAEQLEGGEEKPT